MSCDQTYPPPQVFLIDGGGGGPPQSAHPSSLVPNWSFPPPQRTRRPKSHGCMEVSPGTALIVLLLFLLVFAALGIEAYHIYDLQKEVRRMREVTPVTAFQQPEKQISHLEPDLNHGGDKGGRAAAHLMGRNEIKKFSTTLRWEPHVEGAFTSGGVSYRFEDGALQVNETGLYHIYSRVELIFKDCSPTTSFSHSVFVRRGGRPTSDNLMEAHRAGFCVQQPGHPWTTESYLASGLQLQKNDRVFVNVSQPRSLTHAHYANFFGLYKI